MNKQNLKRGDKVVIKSIFQLLAEAWEPIIWGWIKNRTDNQYLAHEEISFYQGIENILDDSRVLTVAQSDSGHSKYIHCVETDYHIAREVIGMVL
jgi:hypothetical protein